MEEEPEEEKSRLAEVAAEVAAEDELNGALLHDVMDGMETLIKQEIDPDSKMALQLW